MKNDQSPKSFRRSQLVFWTIAFGSIVVFGLISLFIIVPAATAAW